PEVRGFGEVRWDRQLAPRLAPSDVVQEAQLEVVRRMDDFLKRRPMPFHLWIRKAAYERLLERSLAGAANPGGMMPDGPVTGVLGDFRILREGGRGSMGVGYEGEQIALGPRVALKVLPFAAAMDAKQLQHFKNEAQAAAHLQHRTVTQGSWHRYSGRN